MKTRLRLLSTFGCAFATILRVHAQAYIVPNGVTYAFNDPFVGAEIHVIQNPTNGDYTGFSLPPQGANMFLFSSMLDEGVRTFLASSNAPISLQAILAGSYPELTSLNTYFFANGTPFYLGFYTGYNPWIITNGPSFYTGIYTDPLFGWGQFVNNQGVIQMLDGALEIQGGGIYAGTLTILPVPEPGVLGLFGIGVLLLGLRKKRANESLQRTAGSRFSQLHAQRPAAAECKC